MLNPSPAQPAACDIPVTLFIVTPMQDPAPGAGGERAPEVGLTCPVGLALGPAPVMTSGTPLVMTQFPMTSGFANEMD